VAVQYGWGSAAASPRAGLCGPYAAAGARLTGLRRNGASLAVRLRELVEDIRANPKRYVHVDIF
jgi:hypothetical protein